MYGYVRNLFKSLFTKNLLRLVDTADGKGNVKTSKFKNM